MEAIIARPILLAAVAIMIPVAAHAIEIKTPTVTVPHVNVPQVKTPQTTVHVKTPEVNTHLSTGSGDGKTIQGAGNPRYQGKGEKIPLIGQGVAHPPSTATSNTPSGGQTTAAGGTKSKTVGGANATTVGTSGSGSFDNTYLRFQFGSTAASKIQWGSSGGGAASGAPSSFNKIDPTWKASVVSLIGPGGSGNAASGEATGAGTNEASPELWQALESNEAFTSADLSNARPPPKSTVLMPQLYLETRQTKP
jgi:hypothetical protein